MSTPRISRGVASLREMALGHVIRALHQNPGDVAPGLAVLPVEVQDEMARVYYGKPGELGWWVVWVNISSLVSVVPPEYLLSGAACSLRHGRISLADVLVHQYVSSGYRTKDRPSSFGLGCLRRNESGSKVVERALLLGDGARAKRYRSCLRYRGAEHPDVDLLRATVRLGNMARFQTLVAIIDKKPVVRKKIRDAYFVRKLMSKAIASGNFAIYTEIRRLFPLGSGYADNTLQLLVKRGDTERVREYLSTLGGTKPFISSRVLIKALVSGYVEILDLVLGSHDFQWSPSPRAIMRTNSDTPWLIVVLIYAIDNNLNDIIQRWWRDNVVCKEIMYALIFNWNVRWLVRALCSYHELSPPSFLDSTDLESWIASHLGPFLDPTLEQHLLLSKGSHFVSLAKVHSIVG